MKSSDKPGPITRRKFINLGVQGYAGLGLAHALPLMGAYSCASDSSKTVYGACYHDCPDTCSWSVTVTDNKISKFEARNDNLYTAGKLCNKMDNFPEEVTFHPDRVLTPLKRTGKKGAGEFEPISWEQAIREVAQKLQQIHTEKGNEAIMPYSFAGTEGLVQRGEMPERFFAHIGATKLERTICGDAAVAGVTLTNGQTTGVLPEDIIHSRYIILWGTNTITSNQHLWPLIQEAKGKGAKIIVVDPFQSHTAAAADWHVQPLPGTDTVLALAMIHVILAENLQDQDYIDQYTTGIDELKTHVQQYDPKSAAVITGLEEDTIRTLAREYAKGSPSLIRILIGMEHQANGASAFRAVAMLPAITGAWRQLGGGLMHMTYELFGKALNWERLTVASSLEKPETRSVNMIQIGRALTDPGMNPPIHGLFVFNSNPAVIAPNQNLVIKGLEREDLFTVVLEHFITDTARYADYVFPATSQLEHWDLLTSWGQAYINLNQPAIPPVGEAKPNSEFFRLLAKEMEFTADYLFESDLDIIKKTVQSDHEYLKGITFDSLLKTGWAKLNIPTPWTPHATGNFGNPSGKCEFYKPGVEPSLPTYTAKVYTAEELKKYPLHLLTVKSTKHFLNTSHANVNRLRTGEGNPFLDIHEIDAKARGIADGDEVKVFNDRGEVILIARIRSKVRAGVACMPQGFWSSLMKGRSSANALTDDLLTDMGGGGAFHENRVEVVKV